MTSDILTPDEADAIADWVRCQPATRKQSALLAATVRAQAARIEEQRADNNALRKRIQDARPMVGLADD